MIVDQDSSRGENEQNLKVRNVFLEINAME